MSIYAKVIADSINSMGDRLTTLECRFHRFILPEVNTHRAFSRNSASSRAIPSKKLIEQVRTNPACPLEFGRNQPGMQATDVLNPSESGTANLRWTKMANAAADNAEALYEMGIHKQVVNRILEPYMWHTAIISSTTAGWLNFLDQRDSPLAQPEIRELALCIKFALCNSAPVLLLEGEWHLPYLTDEEVELYGDAPGGRKISVARCARVSYLTHDGKRDLGKDLDLYEKLVNADPPHWSPLEHVATPTDDYRPQGNFNGWEQLRHLPEYQ